MRYGLVCVLAGLLLVFVYRLYLICIFPFQRSYFFTYIDPVFDAFAAAVRRSGFYSTKCCFFLTLQPLCCLQSRFFCLTRNT